jgi:hypothetical protein
VREAGSGDYEEMLVELRPEDKRRFDAHDEVLHSLKECLESNPNEDGSVYNKELAKGPAIYILVSSRLKPPLLTFAFRKI